MTVFRRGQRVSAHIDDAEVIGSQGHELVDIRYRTADGTIFEIAVSKSVLSAQQPDGGDLSAVLAELSRSNLTAEQDKLWQLILAKAEQLAAEHSEHRQSRRGVAMISSDGRTVSSHLELGMPDGTAKVFHITAWTSLRGAPQIHVERWYHHYEDLWEREIAEGLENAVIVDNVLYRIRREPSERELREWPSCFGFGGGKWVVRFHDGREVVTHNLWHVGTIPPPFRDRLPDNAEFVREQAVSA